MGFNKEVLFSSKGHTWATRPEVFEAIKLKLNRDYNLDPCAIAATAKCDNYITPEIDLFKTDWCKPFNLNEVRAFMNPEYGLKQTLFINRLIDQVKTHGGYGDVLIPSRTDTKLYHEVLLKYADKITYLHGRIVFGTDEYWEGIWASEVLNGKNNPLYQRKGCFTSGPFPVMVVSFTKASIESMVGPTYDTMRAPKAVYKG